jgi:hypothetical protein
VRRSGIPWAFDDPKTGRRRQAKNNLQRLFHRPFYAGWATSKRFGIALGEVRGNWEPIITTEEFERGIAILRRHDLNKSRQRRRESEGHRPVVGQTPGGQQPDRRQQCPVYLSKRQVGYIYQ